MNTINFILAIHNHQPVGNFDDVVEGAYQTAYRPFLDVLERHPAIKVALHNSGCLIDWLLEHRPEYLDQLERLVDRGQIEILTGGYYEPILPSIPDADREGQVRKLSEWLERRFGQAPRGLWLTERVWEPSLVGPLARAGVGYTMVDDTHFLAAGLSPDDLWGHYLTEDQALPLHVFPISKKLRYLIPFADPEETVALLRKLAGTPDRTALLGDDGEKFGVWPNTHRLVYEEGWLDRFFRILTENHEWIRMRFPSEVIQSDAPQGKVYLPTASYEEMMEWALPSEVQNRFHEFRIQVESNGAHNTQFVRGGLWRNFFARYPESDHINKRMLMVRAEAETLPEGADRDRALDLLWSAQCNCAYWHGVFGGLYLPHLRSALYDRILAAEHLVDGARRGSEWTAFEIVDFDCDGDDELFLRNPDLTLVFSPREGGGLQELSVKPLQIALGNGLSRRPEAYHRRVEAAGAEGEGAGAGAGAEDGTQSIHDLVLSKETGLERYLRYDDYRRVSLLDHFLEPEADLEAFVEGKAAELGDFLRGSYAPAQAEDANGRVLSLRRSGSVAGPAPRKVAVEKRIRLRTAGSAFEVTYLLENLETEPLDVRFGVEWNFAMMAGRSPDHHYVISGVADTESAFASVGETEDVSEIRLVDRHRGFSAGLKLDRPARLWRLPVETVSLSESGFERIYQSSTLLPSWALTLIPGRRHELVFRLEVTSL